MTALLHVLGVDAEADVALRRYTYINPVYWTLYGLIGSQLVSHTPNAGQLVGILGMMFCCAVRCCSCGCINGGCCVQGDVTDEQLTLQTGGSESVATFINTYFG